jgi:hypothetical protein
MNRNIVTQTQSATLPQQVGGTYNPTWQTSPDALIAAGWRIETAQPGAIATGYERLSIRWIQDPGNPQGAIPQYTDTLIATRVAAEAAAKAAGIAFQSELDNAERIVKGLGLTILDEINLVRQWTADYKVVVAAATSLANLQTRVAAMPDLAQRTAAQLKAAVLAKAQALP